MSNQSKNIYRLFLASTVLAGPIAHAQSVLIEEIVVTAQKREQNIQDVSIAVTAFSGNQLDALGVVQPIDIHHQVPNFHMKNEVGKATPTLTIRGVGIGAFSHNSVSPVSVYVDEVFLPSTTQMGFSVFDIERVEVLKGPQGTLFGRNTTAGTVAFVSKKPTDDFEAEIVVGAGNYESARVEGFISGPLSDNVSARLAGSWTKQDEGYFFNRVTGQDIGDTDLLGLKGSLLWDISDSATLLLQVHGGRDRSENHPWIGIGSADPNLPVANPNFPGGEVFPTDCAPIATTSIRFFQENCVTKNGYRDPDLDSFAGDWSQNSVLDTDAFGAVARLDWDLGNVTLTSVTGVDSLEKTTQEDFDGSPFALGDSSYFTDISVFSQELRLVSNEPVADRFSWIAGVVYYSEEQDEDDLYGYVDRGNHDVRLTYNQETTSLGVFFHTETQITDSLSLIAGARYTDDEIDFVGETTIENIQPGGPQPVFGPFTFITLGGEFGTHPNPNAIAVANDTLEEDEVTYKIGLDYRPNDDWLLYGSYSHGYKSGGFVGFWTTISPEFGPYQSEFVDSIEFGFKSTLAGGSVVLNGAIFQYDYEDAQIFGFTPSTGFTIQNAGEGDFVGGELELRWNAAEGLDLIAGLGYIDAELVISGGAPVRPGNTPELTFNGVVRYETMISDNLQLMLQTDFSFQDDTFFDSTERLPVSQEAYWLTNARVGLSNADNSWDVTAWVKNLGDEEYFGSIFRSGTAEVLSALAGNPQTYGIDVTFRF